MYDLGEEIMCHRCRRVSDDYRPLYGAYFCNHCESRIRPHIVYEMSSYVIGNSYYSNINLHLRIVDYITAPTERNLLYTKIVSELLLDISEEK